MSNANETNASNSTTTCVVGCKLPHGLQCELRDKNGNTTDRHVIKGMNDARIVGGYGITQGVPKSFMEEWFKRNFKHPAVVNGMIFMQTDTSSAEAQAKEGRDIRTGLESIDPLKDGTRHGIVMDKESETEYRRQMQDNPVRDRQIVE